MPSGDMRLGDSMWFQSTEAVPGVGQRTASEAMDITETGIQSITIRHELVTPGATQMLIMDKF